MASYIGPWLINNVRLQFKERAGQYLMQQLSVAVQRGNAVAVKGPVGGPTSDLVCTSCTPRAQENGAIGLVVLQSTESLALIICFAIHFL